MSYQEALAAADAVRARRPYEVYTSVVYQYTRGVYAAIVYGTEETVVLVDAEAVRMYQASHPARATGAGDGTQA